MIFTPISSSSAGNLHLLEDGDGHRLAIECGLRYSEMQRQLNYRITELDGVLLSHSHGDHARAAKDVLRSGVPIYALKKTLEELEIADNHNAIPVEPCQPFTIDERRLELQLPRWRVLPFDLRHDIPALGFVVSDGDDKLLYVTDTAYVPHRFQGLTMIAIEANYSEAILRESEEGAARKLRSLRFHMSIERLLGFLAVNDLGTVREVHLIHLSDRHSDANLFRRLVEEAIGKPVYVAGR